MGIFKRNKDAGEGRFKLLGLFGLKPDSRPLTLAGRIFWVIDILKVVLIIAVIVFAIYMFMSGK